jgi:hypothetical protein
MKIGSADFHPAPMRHFMHARHDGGDDTHDGNR